MESILFVRALIVSIALDNSTIVFAAFAHLTKSGHYFDGRMVFAHYCAMFLGSHDHFVFLSCPSVHPKAASGLVDVWRQIRQADLSEKPQFQWVVTRPS